MSLFKATSIVILTTSLAIALVTAADVPPIGASVRFQIQELGSEWNRGFFNQTRTVPPCYLILTFVVRSSPDEPLRLNRTVPITLVERLQITIDPGSSMQEWGGLAPSTVPENSWHEIDLALLQPGKDQCQFDESLGTKEEVYHFDILVYKADNGK